MQLFVPVAFFPKGFYSNPHPYEEVYSKKYCSLVLEQESIADIFVGIFLLMESSFNWNAEQ